MMNVADVLAHVDHRFLSSWIAGAGKGLRAGGGGGSTATEAGVWAGDLYNPVRLCAA